MKQLFCKDISAVIDKTNHVKEIIISGPSFWNAGSIDDSFILAFIKQYRVKNFSTGTNILGLPYHKGTIENAKIIINPTIGVVPGSISIEYTEAKGGYSF